MKFYKWLKNKFNKKLNNLTDLSLNQLVDIVQATLDVYNITSNIKYFAMISNVDYIIYIYEKYNCKAINTIRYEDLLKIMERGCEQTYDYIISKCRR